MEPNRTRQVIQDLARTFNKLASELTADLTYAAREIESLRKEVQRLRSSPGKAARTNGSSKKTARVSKPKAPRSKLSHTETAHSSTTHDLPKPAHEPGSFVFPQEPFSTTPQSEPTGTGNN
ncbi:MAG TPA: hypothetical protein VE955_09830 [Candidatus Dormibacteraeota bacterium]|nr:hypothetical protein [Candidatus Dormibacteraeota bacterium]